MLIFAFFVDVQSMCRTHYQTLWAHEDSEYAHCPNLIPSDHDRAQFPWLQNKESVPVRVKYPDFVTHHETLVGFWNDWYSAYANADFPRLIVRMEDLVFHAKAVTSQVCHCAGGDMKEKFTYIVESAKDSGKDRTSFVDAVIRYGKDMGRLTGMSKEDLHYARTSLDPKLMELFGYQYDEVP